LHVLPITAQWVHRLEVAITRGAEGKGGKAFVGHLNEEKSLELASKIAGEGFVFGVRRRGMMHARVCVSVCVHECVWTCL